MLHRLRRQAKGFTLIELLIVVAIIGVLAAIAIPNLLGAQRRARISRALADTRQIVSQAQLFNNDTQAFPINVAAMATVGYISQTVDPFSTANPQVDYGFGTGGPVWALSVGPGGGTTAPTLAWPLLSGNTSGAACAGVVGFQTDLGAVSVTGC